MLQTTSPKGFQMSTIFAILLSIVTSAEAPHEPVIIIVD